jgi:hypothetical protein
MSSCKSLVFQYNAIPARVQILPAPPHIDLVTVL